MSNKSNNKIKFRKNSRKNSYCKNKFNKNWKVKKSKKNKSFNKIFKLNKFF